MMVGERAAMTRLAAKVRQYCKRAGISLPPEHRPVRLETCGIVFRPLAERLAVLWCDRLVRQIAKLGFTCSLSPASSNPVSV